MTERNDRTGLWINPVKDKQGNIVKTDSGNERKMINWKANINGSEFYVNIYKNDYKQVGSNQPDYQMYLKPVGGSSASSNHDADTWQVEEDVDF